MFEIKVSIEVPALVEAAKILAMRQLTQVEAKPEKIEQIHEVVEAPVMAAPITPAPMAPVAAPPQTPAPSGPSRAEVAKAGALLLSKQPGIQAQLIALLGKYGAQTVQDIPESQLGAFALDLRQAGAQI